ncbi:glycoside hydrolase family 61 protein F [Marasmius fiardii PR-910]|nr:glycoside hydrolase family 61 protein F [Marasmius fiardii PR-910]
MLKFALIGCLISTIISSVQGHGYVQQITANGKNYSGWLPFNDPYVTPIPQRIVRKFPDNGPVEDLSLIDIQCNGWAAQNYATAPAPLVAQVAAGSQMALNWTLWPDGHKGPMMTYMARAPTDITKWMPGTAAVWFKIAEDGKDSNGLWAASDKLNANNGIYTLTIPKNLRPGQYIIRHEILALHFASTYPGVQVYPSCIQVEVTGSGNAFPTSFVSFPGAYTPSTPGMVWDIYTDTAPYPIPGPAVWTGGN